jgi:hypothetical protein
MKFFFIRLFMSRAWDALLDEKNSTKLLSFIHNPTLEGLADKENSTSFFIH